MTSIPSSGLSPSAPISASSSSSSTRNPSGKRESEATPSNTATSTSATATPPPPQQQLATPAETIAELYRNIESEKAMNRNLHEELKRKDEEIKKIKHNTVNLQTRVEEEEEFITNSLLKRLEKAKKEKEQLAKQVEMEEEFMVNNLQRKLDTLRREKVELERHLEAEQEYFVNKLQKQLLEITRQKNALERKLNEGRSGLLQTLEHSVEDYKGSLHQQSSPQERAGLRQLEDQIRALQAHQNEVEKEACDYRDRCEALAKQLEALNNEKFLLKAKTLRYKEQLEQLRLEREAEFQQEELCTEREFNMSIRSEDSYRSSCSCNGGHPGAPRSSSISTPASRSLNLTHSPSAGRSKSDGAVCYAQPQATQSQPTATSATSLIVPDSTLGPTASAPATMLTHPPLYHFPQQQPQQVIPPIKNRPNLSAIATTPTTSGIASSASGTSFNQLMVGSSPSYASASPSSASLLAPPQGSAGGVAPAVPSPTPSPSSSSKRHSHSTPRSESIKRHTEDVLRGSPVVTSLLCPSRLCGGISPRSPSPVVL